jgi:hypothetical protein
LAWTGNDIDDGVYTVTATSAGASDSPKSTTATVEVNPSGGATIVPANIVYTQSTVYPGNTAATNANMNNGNAAEALATATNTGNPSFVQMDFGQLSLVRTITIGCDFTNTVTPGSWGRTYTENATLERSDDGTTWTTVQSPVGTFATAFLVISVNLNARYIRLSRGGSNYVVVTEFTASSTP